MDVKQTFQRIYSIAEEEGFIENELSFDSAISKMIQNYEQESADELFRMFDEGEYWHALMILQYAFPARYYSYFLDFIEDGDDIEKFVRHIEAITCGDWVISEVSIDQIDDQWNLTINDNFSGTVLALPEEAYSVAEEATQSVISYVNSLPLDNRIEQRFSSSVDAFYLPVKLIERLQTESLLGLQGDPASAFM
jgi:hypothetical protein